MNAQQTAQNPEETLKILEKFGFKFFGYNESKSPLVIAPNGQVVAVDTAYAFLQTQLKNAQTEGTNSIESVPQVQNIENINNIPDINIERNENSLERGENKIENSQETNKASSEPVNKSPKMTIDSNVITPFGDGYSKFQKIDLDLSRPENVTKLENFIQTNAKKSNSDPIKWLSYMFQKTLQELSEGSSNQ